MVETNSNPKPPNRFLTVILRWFLIALSVFVLTVLTGVYITWEILPKVYTATAEIQIRPPSEIIDGLSMSPRTFDPTAFQAQFEIIQSADILQPIIHDLNLDKIWAKRVFKQDQLPDKDALAYMNKILKIELLRGTNIV